jgi:hypothetical protein
MKFDTKLVGDIAVQQAILAALLKGWGVLIPVGDRLPYDLVFDVNGVLKRIQVKSAYQTSTSKSSAGRANTTIVVNTLRSKTNRREYKFERYDEKDFDFALIWNRFENLFYVIPIRSFLRFKSRITLASANSSRNRANRSKVYKEAWELLSR